MSRLAVSEQQPGGPWLCLTAIRFALGSSAPARSRASSARCCLPASLATAATWVN